jgi:hypothetical protein
MIVRFPVLLPSAIPPRHSRPRPVVVLRETDIEVPHLSRSHLSEVATVKSTQFGGVQTTTVVSWGKRYFSPRSPDLDRFLSELTDPVDRFLTADHWEELMVSLSHLADRRRVWPPGVESLLTSYRGVAQTVEAMSCAHVRAYPDEDLALHVDHWKRKFEHYMSSFIVVDGEVWSSTHLPHIAVTLRTWETELRLESYDIHDPSYGSRQSDGGAENYFFPLAELENATQFAVELAAQHGRVPKIDPALSIVYVDPFFMPAGSAALELRRVARVMAEATIKTLKKPHVADDLLAMAKQLRGLSCMRPETADVDAIEDLMAEMLSMFRKFHPQLGGHPASLFLVKNYERHFERWLNRPVCAPISPPPPRPQ